GLLQRPGGRPRADLDRDAARLGVGAHPAQTVLLVHAHEPRRGPRPHGPAVGRALVEAAVAAVHADREPFVVLERSPAYYGRLGFEPAAAHGIRRPPPAWAPPEAAQLRPLTGYRRSPGTVVYPAAVQAAFDAVEG